MITIHTMRKKGFRSVKNQRFLTIQKPSRFSVISFAFFSFLFLLGMVIPSYAGSFQLYDDFNDLTNNIYPDTILNYSMDYAYFSNSGAALRTYSPVWHGTQGVKFTDADDFIGVKKSTIGIPAETDINISAVIFPNPSNDVYIGGRQTEGSPPLQFNGEGVNVALHSASGLYVNCNGSFSSYASIDLTKHYEVLIRVRETDNQFDVFLNGTTGPNSTSLVSCDFAGGNTNIENIYIDNHGPANTVYFDNFAVINETIPSGITIISASWDSSYPLNNTYQNANNLTMYFDIIGGDSSTSCDLYTNRSGSYQINNSLSGLSAGTHSIGLETETAELRDISLFISCSDTTGQSNTSIKNIHIDKVNVFIFANAPQNGSSFNETTTSLNMNISYMNTNLDHANFTIYYPNGSYFYSNTSYDIGISEFEFHETVSIPSIKGMWSIDMYGNDSSANTKFQTTYFTLLDQGLIAEWDFHAPLNASVISVSPQTYGYHIQLQNITQANCYLYEDGSQIDYSFITSSGNKTFLRSYTTPTTQIFLYQVNCTQGLDISKTSIKTIQINISADEVTASDLPFSGLFPVVFGFLLISGLFIYVYTTIIKPK